MVDRFDPPRDLDWKPLPMRPEQARALAAGIVAAAENAEAAND